MSENPCVAPIANTRGASSRVAGPTRLYSPAQVACGTIGGPVGLIYFLKANYTALGNDRLEKKTLVYGILLILSLLAILPFLPKEFPGYPFTFLYIFIARHVAEKYQMSKQAIVDSTLYGFHSNWRVLGLGLLCLLASAIVIMGPLMLMAALGIWQP